MSTSSSNQETYRILKVENKKGNTPSLTVASLYKQLTEKKIIEEKKNKFTSLNCLNLLLLPIMAIIHGLPNENS
jgi:hypothetical protein